jgi:hypothetical protein
VFNEKIALFVSEHFLLQSYGWVFEILSGFGFFISHTHPSFGFLTDSPSKIQSSISALSW